MRKGDATAHIDEDVIYQEIGRYVVTFQALETELVQLTSFVLDPDGRRHRGELADLNFSRLVERTRDAVGAFLDEQRGEEKEFRERLNSLLSRCRDLAKYRNRLVHSAFVFLEAGDELVGIIRSDMKQGKGDNDVDLDQEMLREDSFKEAMIQIATVAFGLSQCRLQLIAWHRPPSSEESNKPSEPKPK